MAKKTLWDGAKLMMMVSRKAKKDNSRLFAQRVLHETFGEIVYISNGHVIFPIEAKVYNENATKYGFPLEGTYQDLYKIMREAYDNGKDACYTPLRFDNKPNLVTRIVRIEKGYAMLNTYYTDLIDYLPSVLQDGNLKAADNKSPFVNYKDSCDLGYCILPIYNSKGKGNMFEKTVTDLSCVCDW